MSSKVTFSLMMGLLLGLIVFTAWVVVERNKQTEQMKTAIYKVLPTELKEVHGKRINVLKQPKVDVLSDFDNTWRVTDGEHVWEVTLKKSDDHFDIQHVVQIGTLKVIK